MDFNWIFNLLTVFIDSLNHLFFECPYSTQVWKAIKEKVGVKSLPANWDDIIGRMIRMKHDRTIRSVLLRISLAACVYYIWRERNRRLFAKDKIDNKELTKNVINHIRLKLSSLNVRKSTQTTEVSKEWEVIMKTKEPELM
ncbi:reverse transcriptase domain, Reverse transcriptase zinc-binding domain protein [Artemisia annua]|uniref:Reverse transcriptase domain, Reverse transcriptase zinc-binding domain protein n=1 Tax=Artemisia annua TaxID=35608 RepID=A0A2U1K930_ARTAN|nr:reverse transcriptase domain, Reverse transcriptase zinc-binding domain protein [Artemisia annua]